VNINTDIYENTPNGSGTWTFEFSGPSGINRQAVEGVWSVAKRWAIERATELEAETIILVEGPKAGSGVSENHMNIPVFTSDPCAYVVLKVPDNLALSEVPESHEVSQPGDLHLTLVYLSLIEDQTLDKTVLVNALTNFAEQNQPVVGIVNGYGVFDTPDDRRAIHLLFDSPSLPEFRQALIKALLEAGALIDRRFGFIPHITLAYAPKEGELFIPETSKEPITLDTLQLYWGSNDRSVFALKSGYDVLVPEDLQVLEEDPIERKPGGLLLAKYGNVAFFDPLTNALTADGKRKGEEIVSDTLVAWGGPIKAIGIKNGKGILGGQLVLYGAEAEKDLTGDWFSVKTYYGPRDGDGADGMMHHGIPLGKGLEEFADHLFSPLKAARNKLGIWAEIACDLADEFEAKVYELGKKGVWKWSSGTADHMIKKDSTGQILRWPIIEGSLTPTPAEPRMLNHRLQPLKAFMDMDWLLIPSEEGIKTVNAQLVSLGEFEFLHDAGLATLALARRRRLRVG
jgi:2'-5' RNA ligase